MQNIAQTLGSQYANSPTLTGIIQAANSAIDPAADISNFYSAIWNLSTASGIGLDIWGKIVGVTRYLTVINQSAYFGFKEAYSASSPQNPLPFNFGTLYPGVTTTTYALPDANFRILILVKALANISDCTVPGLNRLLSLLFSSRGSVYVQDNGAMQITIVCNFTLTPVDLSILESSSLARPAGVLVSIAQGALTSDFGFKEGVGQPFGQGVFYSPSPL